MLAVGKSILLVGLRIYKILLSPCLTALGVQCRFEPTCSQYAYQAIDEYGALKGSALTIRRLLRCHPWHPGGYDPP